MNNPQITGLKTICMHGSPLSPYDNRDLWKRYDFKEFGIVGAAYLSIKDVNYFSDTGRSWNWKIKMRDFMIDNNNDKDLIGVNTTDELINLIKSGRVNRLYTLHIQKGGRQIKANGFLATRMILCLMLGRRFW